MRPILLAAMLALAPGLSHAFELGVIAPRGEAQAINEWTPFAEHLSTQLGVDVNLTTYDPIAGTDAFASRRIDVLIGNPVMTAVVTDTMGGVPLMSVRRASGERFGGVILARAGANVTEASDIRNLRVGTLGDWAAGGFVFQAAYLAEAGIDVRTEAAEHFRGTDQIELVFKLLTGDLDVVFVRTGIVERLVKEGKLSMEDVTVLNPIQDDGFAQVHTTPLYPEWFVVSQNTFGPIAELADVLAQISADDDVAQSANILGFTDPMDVTPVLDAMRVARIAPYD